ncbi:MAG TPA: 6-phosphogluconolactonase [Solirubrobacteraceae bacterium]|jgi:6-phosphogluconolactonase|nr:6-phosphogluconolactonase [Solirubrobacteraceae bacterium]
MTLSFEIVDDPARACAALMVGAVIGGGEIVLTGGSTPRAAYGHFVEAVGTVGIDLSRTRMWMGDERAVGPEDDRANYRMIRESLLDPLGDNQPAMHRIKGELGDAEGAEDYDSILRGAGPPAFDLLLLGIGPDGHCASLFPNQASLAERSRLVVGVPEAGLEPFVPRISCTLPTLALARHVVFLATGASKADAIARAFGPGTEPDPAVPASLLVPEAKRITVLMDQAAAADLPGGDHR